MSQKRAHPRVSAALRVSVKLPDGKALATGQIRNISLGGVFIETATPPPFGTDLDIEFSLPGEGLKPIRCRGFIVWTTKTDAKRGAGMEGMGVRLSAIGVQDMRALAGYIEARLDGPTHGSKG